MVQQLQAEFLTLTPFRLSPVPRPGVPQGQNAESSLSAIFQGHRDTEKADRDTNPCPARCSRTLRAFSADRQFLISPSYKSVLNYHELEET
ncbi:hypothetical protein NDI45_12745 [Leptolyngbya sp. GB1-A1]|uniref:hypothetical protein n=1 Tax=Leptolyngbya sp. GB1-A1 TaxID=2933908 RepID=UPI003298BAB9